MTPEEARAEAQLDFEDNDDVLIRVDQEVEEVEDGFWVPAKIWVYKPEK